MSRVIVRFAPSPTGFLHIGGARTAITNIMFAKHHNGTGILRIDDTDLARSEQKYEKEIMDSLTWLGLVFQETYYQSRRTDIYESYIDQLMDKGMVYTDKGEKGEALVFKADKKDLSFHDLIRGKISMEASEVTDIVIRKSDGTPTYIFASTVDDIDLGITHIIRGEDHITNTFKQILLFEAIRPAQLPIFTHLPLIHSEDGTRLSKRHGATSVTEFRKMGYLSEALRNYLLLLGWSPGSDRELIDFEEACRLFQIENVKKKASQFSYEKAAWMNGQYIKQMPAEELVRLCIDIGMGEIKKYSQDNKEKLYKAFDLAKSRPRLLMHFDKAVAYFFEPEIAISEALLKKHLSQNDTFKNSIAQIRNAIKDVSEFQSHSIEACLRELSIDLGVKAKQILIPLRVILTGQDVTPGIFDVMELMGKELCIKRILDFQACSKK